MVGHSMSGLLVLKYAEAHPVGGLIVSQSGPPANIIKKRGIDVQRPAAAKDRRMMTDTVVLPMKDREKIEALLFDRGNVDEENIRLVQEMVCEESLQAIKELMQVEIDPEKIIAPVFVLGFNSAKIGLSTSVDLNRILAEEFHAAGYSVIEPGGHNYMLEKNWLSFARQFEAWLQFEQP